MNAIVGKERLAMLDCIIAGDDVDRTKPDPMIYNIAAERLGVPNGMQCAKISSLLSTIMSRQTNHKMLL